MPSHGRGFRLSRSARHDGTIGPRVVEHERAGRHLLDQARPGRGNRSGRRRGLRRANRLQATRGRSRGDEGRRRRGRTNVRRWRRGAANVCGLRLDRERRCIGRSRGRMSEGRRRGRTSHMCRRRQRRRARDLVGHGRSERDQHAGVVCDLEHGGRELFHELRRRVGRRRRLAPREIVFQVVLRFRSGHRGLVGRRNEGRRTDLGRSARSRIAEGSNRSKRSERSTRVFARRRHLRHCGGSRRRRNHGRRRSCSRGLGSGSHRGRRRRRGDVHGRRRRRERAVRRPRRGRSHRHVPRRRRRLGHRGSDRPCGLRLVGRLRRDHGQRRRRDVGQKPVFSGKSARLQLGDLPRRAPSVPACSPNGRVRSDQSTREGSPELVEADPPLLATRIGPAPLDLTHPTRIIHVPEDWGSSGWGPEKGRLAQQTVPIPTETIATVGCDSWTVPVPAYAAKRP